MVFGETTLNSCSGRLPASGLLGLSRERASPLTDFLGCSSPQEENLSEFNALVREVSYPKGVKRSGPGPTSHQPHCFSKNGVKEFLQYAIHLLMSN